MLARTNAAGGDMSRAGAHARPHPLRIVLLAMGILLPPLAAVACRIFTICEMLACNSIRRIVSRVARTCASQPIRKNFLRSDFRPYIISLMIAGLESLQAALAARCALDNAIAQQVLHCRASGVSWGEIALATGVSKATAIERWGQPGKPTRLRHERDRETWPYLPGDQVRREALHERFGGNRQSGIAPSRTTSEVMLFTTINGARHGYDDCSHPDGTWSYVGEGQHGDQKVTRGNLAIVGHERVGRRLRLFQGLGGGQVAYIGRFRYAGHEQRRSHCTAARRPRKVLVFTLEPLAE
jgi:hypothetical protein